MIFNLIILVKIQTEHDKRSRQKTETDETQKQMTEKHSTMLSVSQIKMSQIKIAYIRLVVKSLSEKYAFDLSEALEVIGTSSVADPKPRTDAKKIAQAKAETKAQAKAEAKAEAKSEAKAQAKAKQAKEEQLTVGHLPDAQAVIKIFERVNQDGKLNDDFIYMLIARKMFNPRVNINKFITGGVVEEVVHQRISKSGFDCQNVSQKNASDKTKDNVIDLEVKVPIGPTDVIHCLKLSLKNSGDINRSPILENYRGKKRDDIRPLPPTLIIYTEVKAKRVKIVYLDHEIIRRGYPTLNEEEFAQVVYKNKDSNLTFKSGFLRNFIPRLPEEYILTADYPKDLPVVQEQSIIPLVLAEVKRILLSIPDTKK